MILKFQHYTKTNEEIALDGELFQQVDDETAHEDPQYQREEFTTRDLKAINKIFKNFHIIPNPVKAIYGIDIYDKIVDTKAETNVSVSVLAFYAELCQHNFGAAVSVGMQARFNIQKIQHEFFLVTFSKMLYGKRPGAKWSEVELVWPAAQGSEFEDDGYFLCDGSEGLKACYNYLTNFI